MKKLILKLLLSLVTLTTATTITLAKDYGFKEPKWLYSSTTCITITNVQFTDSATIVDIHERHNPTWWVLINKSTVLIDQDGKEYKLIKGEGVTPGELFITPECGYADFKLYFEPMPANTRFFDYIAGHKSGEFRIYGVHNSDNPIQVPNFLPKLDIEEFESNFYNEGIVVLKGVIENYSNEKSSKTILIPRINAITRTDTPITIDINPDGTFETSFKANHPKIEMMVLRENQNEKIYYFYTVPGCTTELKFDKDFNMTMSSKDLEVWECQRMINHNMIELCRPKPYMEIYAMSKEMTFHQFTTALLYEQNEQLKLIDYIAWREHFTLIERYYAKLTTEINYCTTIFDYYNHISSHIDDSSLSEAKQKFFQNEYHKEPTIEEYKFIKQAPYNDIACLAIPNFNILINRYNFSKILYPELYGEGIAVKYTPFKKARKIIKQNNLTMYKTDMSVTGNDKPSLWAKLIAVNNLEYDLKHKFKNRKSQERYCKSIKQHISDYPVITAEVDKLNNKIVNPIGVSYKLPHNVAATNLKRIIDKYKGKFVLIDFWGMACGPCRAGIQSSLELREKFRNHPDIEFVFISKLESSKEAYDEYVQKYLEDEDVNLVSEEEFDKFMELLGS